MLLLFVLNDDPRASSMSSSLDKAALLNAFFAIRLAADTLCVVLDPTELTLSGAVAVACRLRDAGAGMPSIASLAQGTENAAETLGKLVQMLIKTGAGTKFKPMSEKDAAAFLLLAVPAFLQLKAARRILRDAILGPSTKKTTARRSAFREPAPESIATVTTEVEEVATATQVVPRDKEEKKRKKKDREKMKKAAANERERTATVETESAALAASATFGATVPSSTSQQEQATTQPSRRITFLPADPAGRKKPPRVSVQPATRRAPAVVATLASASKSEVLAEVQILFETAAAVPKWLETGDAQGLDAATARLFALQQSTHGRYGEEHHWGRYLRAVCLVQAGRLLGFQGLYRQAVDAGRQGLELWRTLVEEQAPADRLHPGFVEAMSVILHAVVGLHETDASRIGEYEQLARECFELNHLLRQHGPSEVPAYLVETGLGFRWTRNFNQDAAADDDRTAASVLAVCLQDKSPAMAIATLRDVIKHQDPDSSHILFFNHMRSKLRALALLYDLERQLGRMAEALKTALERSRVVQVIGQAAPSFYATEEARLAEDALEQARREAAEWARGQQG